MFSQKLAEEYLKKTSAYCATSLMEPQAQDQLQSCSLTHSEGTGAFPPQRDGVHNQLAQVQPYGTERTQRINLWLHGSCLSQTLPLERLGRHALTPYYIQTALKRKALLRALVPQPEQGYPTAFDLVCLCP